MQIRIFLVFCFHVDCDPFVCALFLWERSLRKRIQTGGNFFRHLWVCISSFPVHIHILMDAFCWRHHFFYSLLCIIFLHASAEGEMVGNDSRNVLRITGFWVRDEIRSCDLLRSLGREFDDISILWLLQETVPDVSWVILTIYIQMST